MTEKIEVVIDFLQGYNYRLSEFLLTWIFLFLSYEACKNIISKKEDYRAGRERFMLHAKYESQGILEFYADLFLMIVMFVGTILVLLLYLFGFFVKIIT